MNRHEEEKIIFCRNCGERIEEGTKEAGFVAETNSALVRGAEKPKETKRKGITLLLLIFLGVIGGHKFYEGDSAMGFLYISLMISYPVAPPLTVALLSMLLLVDFVVLLYRPKSYHI